MNRECARSRDGCGRMLLFPLGIAQRHFTLGREIFYAKIWKIKGK
jgi:hypothetical protein